MLPCLGHPRPQHLHLRSAVVAVLACILAIGVRLAAAVSSQGSRVLALHDSLAAKDSYSVLWTMLERHGYSIAHQSVTDPGWELDVYGGTLYDHILHLAPSTKKYGNNVKVTDFLRFVQSGGNLLMAVSPAIAEPTRDLAAQFGVEFDYPDTFVTDHFAFDQTPGADDGSHTRIVVSPSQLSTNASAIVPALSAPVVFEGLGHATTRNPLALRVLSASQLAYSFDRTYDGTSNAKLKPVDEEPVIAGSDIGLVTSAQILNNARATFIGSLAMLTDDYLNAPIVYANPNGGAAISVEKNGCLELVEHLIQWTFQESSVIRATSIRHHHTATGQRPPYYRVKDMVTYEIDLTQHHPDGEWRPYIAHDVQLEFTMLDPYIRVNLVPQPVEQGATSATHRVEFMAPENHGMFAFRVNYKRHGLSYILAEDVISVRPFNHDEFPRFVPAAWPYYLSAASMLVSFVAVSAAWMWNKEPTKRRED